MTTPADRQQGTAPDTEHVPAPDSGVRGADAVARLDSDAGHAAAGADGQTAAREQLRTDLGERAPTADTEAGQVAPELGETDDPQGGSLAEHGSRPA